MKEKGLFFGMIAVLVVATFGFIGCEESSDPQSDAKSIIAFSIGETDGVIDETDGRIYVTLPAGESLDALTPAVVVSAKARIINPSDGKAIDLTTPVDFTNSGKNYTVKAEDGSTQTYYISVTTATAEEPAGKLEVTIGFVSSAGEPVVFGVPTGGIVLSRYGVTTATPSSVVISVDANVWSSNYSSGSTWYIDGEQYSSNTNIITINASGGYNNGTNFNYTLDQPHTITFVGINKEGVQYSKTIAFKVVK
jgi:hypothetical protein